MLQSKRRWRATLLLPGTLLLLLSGAALTEAGRANAGRTGEGTDMRKSEARVPENLYRGELAAYPGAWSFLLGRSDIILVSDRQLEALSDPDKVLNLALTFDKREESLRQICERARAAGHRTLILAFDHFFSQYRPGQEGPRRLTPDMDEYVQRIAAISRFAQGYGLGLELSLLSPLEIGPAYTAQTGESGVWMHFRKGTRDPKTGAFSVSLWRQRNWANNKGVISIADAGVRVFAFRETPVSGTPYRVVAPKALVEISDGVRVELVGEPQGNAGAQRVQVRGEGQTGPGDLNRVLVVQSYKTPEMDYFGEGALPFLQKLVDKYADAGVKLNGLYSDEMHIQQDWNYFGHHDNGEFALRYVSPGLARRFAALYGDEYRDFAKYLIYFVHGQEDYATDLSAGEDAMHVFGATPEAIRRTALFRSRYYRLLQDGVVELFVKAKRHAETRMGHRLDARAHATWAQSPTIDFWRTGAESMHRNAYEYTSNFVWSNTVHQAASACHDYFAWGDFLTGNGNDHAEGGWLDRDYYGLALACSTGILNEVPLSYAAHWGMPAEVSRRRDALVSAYGAAGSPLYGMVQEMQHRDVEVLMLYPLDLVAVEERFGSWMTQYGYANYVTPAKLLERGRVVNGAIEMAGRRFTTLVALFEPFPSKRLLGLLRRFVEGGGRLVWSGPPPVLSQEGDSILAEWQNLAGVDYTPAASEGRLAPGRQIVFEGALKGVAPQTVLTDFLVDRIYPVAPRRGTRTVARVEGKELIVGTRRTVPGGGSVTFLGYRPRDDQSRSLGYESRNWFEALSALGAYPASGRWQTVNDNTEHLSRTTSYLACRFPNGATAIAPHLRELEEGWPGGFARNAEQDREIIKKIALPSEALHLRGFKVNGHTVSYDGEGAVTFRVNAGGALIAFAGRGAQRITVDGRTTVFADAGIREVAWAPLAATRRVRGGAALQIMARGKGTVRIPVPKLPDDLQLFVEGPMPGRRGEPVPSRRAGGFLVFTVGAAQSDRWLYAVPGQAAKASG